MSQHTVLNATAVQSYKPLRNARDGSPTMAVMMLYLLSLFSRYQIYNQYCMAISHNIFLQYVANHKNQKLKI